MPPEDTSEDRLYQRLVTHGIPPSDARAIARNKNTVPWNEVFQIRAELAELTGASETTIHDRGTREGADPRIRPKIFRAGPDGRYWLALYMVDEVLAHFEDNPITRGGGGFTRP